MVSERGQLILVTSGLVALFAAFETAKTILFPGMNIITSHVLSTIVVGLIAVVTGRFAIRRQAQLLRERARGNEQLREALNDAEHTTSLLQSIVASVGEGLVITDRNFHVILTNEAARLMLEVGDRPTERLADLTRAPQIHQAFASVLETGEHVEGRVEVWSNQKSSLGRRVLHLHAAPLQLSEHQVKGIVGAFIDITQLERLERMRQEFLANVSHELRTPLASITAYVETLLNGGLDDSENRLRFLRAVERNAERMRDLVEDISELSAIESGAVRLNLERVPLRKMVDDIFTGLALRCEKQRVRLLNEVDQDCELLADRRRLEQILTNLIDNAIKFNRPNGEVAVTAVTTDNDYILTKVRDTGPGIPPDHLSRIFERFYRVDKARSREVGGTGLGLAIVKHLARAHGGEAYVTSEAGAGCEFVIKLPNRQATAPFNEVVRLESQLAPTMGENSARPK